MRIKIGEKSEQVFEGKVKKWFEKGGYGFIGYENEDIFVHITKVINKETLSVGDKVKFRILITPKGKQAMEVEKDA